VGTIQADDGSFQIAGPLDGPNEALFVVAGRRDDELVRLLFTRLCAFDEASGAVREARGRRRTLGHFSRLWEEGRTELPKKAIKTETYKFKTDPMLNVDQG